MGYEELASTCVGKACTYQIQGDFAVCANGSGDCAAALLLDAEISGFHDEHLAEATRQIRSILDGIPEDPNGRKLSFIITNMGILLARVDHGAELPEGGVTNKDDDATIARALRLKGIEQSAGM